MKKIELGLFFILVIALLNKLLNLNLLGGSFLLIFSVFSLIFLYIIFGFALLNNIKFINLFNKQAYKNTTLASIMISIIISWSLSLVLVAFLFKAMHWPGGWDMLITGIFMLLIFLFFSIFYINAKQSNNQQVNQTIDSNFISNIPNEKYQSILKVSILQRVVPALILGIIIYFI